ncbi:hypothetical protein [Kitasatospora sp. NPDC096204]|uniref:hypothetical protein n=1 Tax=Kitasatospora sp. NPDC096204 TaxID=3364094 RepID=UPI00380AE885
MSADETVAGDLDAELALMLDLNGGAAGFVRSGRRERRSGLGREVPLLLEGHAGPWAGRLGAGLWYIGEPD